MTDTHWLRQIDQQLYGIQRQDPAALHTLYQLTSAKLLGLIQRIIADAHEAQDILQEVYIKVWQQAQQYTGSGSAWGWLCVLARHRAIDRIRALKHRHLATDTPPEVLDGLLENASAINSSDSSDNSELVNRHWLGQCLKQLKPQPRNAILLSCLKGYSHSEITEQLQAPLGTIKAWIRRGMQELQQCLNA